MNSLVGTGQLGSGRRTEGRDELYPGATRSDRIFAEKAEMAPERLAQGKTWALALASPSFAPRLPHSRLGS